METEIRLDEVWPDNVEAEEPRPKEEEKSAAAAEEEANEVGGGGEEKGQDKREFRGHTVRKLSRKASPRRRMASRMFVGVAAANVVRKNMSVGGKAVSARNQEPRPTSTPLAMQASYMDSSISRMLRVFASGCCVWSTLSQCFLFIFGQYLVTRSFSSSFMGSLFFFFLFFLLFVF
jgi:hypothetical protein